MNGTEALLRGVAQVLELPTHVLLLLAGAACFWELGVFLQERFGRPAPEAPAGLMARARSRVDRADILARTGPMLGLMGTLIPLGPGLAALGRGDVAALAQAVTVAFDTTVLGLFVGIFAFALSRARRRLYDRLLDRIEASTAPGEP